MSVVRFLAAVYTVGALAVALILLDEHHAIWYLVPQIVVQLVIAVGFFRSQRVRGDR